MRSLMLTLSRLWPDPNFVVSFEIINHSTALPQNLQNVNEKKKISDHKNEISVWKFNIWREKNVLWIWKWRSECRWRLTSFKNFNTFCMFPFLDKNVKMLLTEAYRLWPIFFCRVFLLPIKSRARFYCCLFDSYCFLIGKRLFSTDASHSVDWIDNCVFSSLEHFSVGMHKNQKR